MRQRACGCQKRSQLLDLSFKFRHPGRPHDSQTVPPCILQRILKKVRLSILRRQASATGAVEHGQHGIMDLIGRVFGALYTASTDDDYDPGALLGLYHPTVKGGIDVVKCDQGSAELGFASRRHTAGGARRPLRRLSKLAMLRMTIIRAWLVSRLSC